MGVALGYLAQVNTNGVSLGAFIENPAANSVVINGAGTWSLTTAYRTTAGFYVRPVRNVGTGDPNLVYDTATGEIYVGAPPVRRQLTGTTPLSSSRRDLTDIQDVATSDSARVWALRPVSYRSLGDAAAHDDGTAHATKYGFVADEVAEVDPRLCFWGQDAEGMPQVEGVNYDQVIPLLLQEARQLKAGREEDAARMENDGVKIAVLEARMAELEKKLEALLG